MNYEDFKAQVSTPEPAFTLQPVAEELSINAGLVILVFAVGLYLFKKKEAATFVMLLSIAVSVAIMCSNW